MDSPTISPYKKPRNSIPDYDILESNKWYAVTINPNDKHQKFGDITRIGTFLNDLSTLLYHNSEIYKYNLWPEVSAKGRLHYHGIIKIYNKNIFYTSSIPHLIKNATIVIKSLDDQQGWDDYCSKQYEFHKYIKENYFTPSPISNYTK